MASNIPDFGNCLISVDWTRDGLFDAEPIKQFEDSGAAVVFTHLLQAQFNKGIADKAQWRVLSYLDLAHKMQDCTKKRKGFSFSNLNHPIKHIRTVGLHSGTKIDGPGQMTTGEFAFERKVTGEAILNKLDHGPLGLILQNTPCLHAVESSDIYQIPPHTPGYWDCALLLLAKGRDPQGGEFVVAKSSWGRKQGIRGYSRIRLPPARKFDIFWPVW